MITGSVQKPAISGRFRAEPVIMPGGEVPVIMPGGEGAASGIMRGWGGDGGRAVG